jgi:three-Cys-motif partner protein
MTKMKSLEGSARRALHIHPPFTRYVFVEKMRGKAKELQQPSAEFPDLATRVEVIEGDANSELISFCNRTNWRSSRAVVFLDPFGNQVRWETIAAVAACPIDLWYLFPSHLGVARQINRDGRVDDAKAESLDKIFGCQDWRSELVARAEVQDLFGRAEVSIRQADSDAATRFMIQRMATVFNGRVLDKWLPLGKNGAQWYSLIFAWGNPSPRAGQIASRIAKHVMQRS